MPATTPTGTYPLAVQPRTRMTMTARSRRGSSRALRLAYEIRISYNELGSQVRVAEALGIQQGTVSKALLVLGYSTHAMLAGIRAERLGYIEAVHIARRIRDGAGAKEVELLCEERAYRNAGRDGRKNGA